MYTERANHREAREIEGMLLAAVVVMVVVVCLCVYDDVDPKREKTTPMGRRRSPRN